MEKREEYAKCTDEQSFKMMFLRRFKSPRFYHFCIETEETVKGFPDVLVIDKFDSKADFIEFKFTKTGKIKFQPTQPAFYKSHPELMINVIAYNTKSQQLHTIDVQELFKEGSAYQMNEKAEVDLCKAEKEIRI